MRTKFLILNVVLIAFLWPLAAQDTAQDQGQLTGIVVSVADGGFVSDATVEIVHLGLIVKTDLDGIYNLDVAPGKYDLKISKDGFLDQTVKGVVVQAGQTTFQDVAFAPQGLDLGEVTVVAEADKTSTTALLVEQKNLPTVSDSIGAQEMSRLVGGDAADVVQRVTGVSIVDDKYVFVRGLGERYSNTMLNNSVLPSTQPDKKVVPMDLFPASLLENIRTEKSYMPDQPGEFAGGTIKVQTVNFPRRPTLKVSGSAGFGTNTTFKDFLTYPGGSWDWFGIDDGTRALPSSIPNEKLIRKTKFSPGFTPEELQGFGRSFANTWTPRGGQNAIPNSGFSVVGGNTFGKLGLVFAYNYSNKSHRQFEEQNFYKVGLDSIERIHDYEFDFNSYSVRTGLTANAAYEITNTQRLLFRNFYTRDTSDESRYYEGFNGDANNEVLNRRLRFVQEDIYSGQWGGEHFIEKIGNSFLEWRLSYSKSSLYEPDIRETMYEKQGEKFLLADESQSGFRMFNDLDEDLIEPAVDWSFFFNRSGFAGSFKTGALYRDRKRDFFSRRFRFVPRRDAREIDLSQDAELIFAPENITPERFELREETRATDTYKAHQINRSFYGMVDMSIAKWRFIGGVRVESDTQIVETFDPFNANDPQNITSRLQNTDPLGSVGVIYRLTPDMNLRGSFSRTVNRPEFRELSPFEFTDVAGGRAVVGNPLLKRATIKNWDTRWEWFPSPGELVSVSFFYKNFKDPIERFIEPTAQLRTSFLNADGARNAGFELDARKNLGFISSGLDYFAFRFNYTFVDSEVDIPEDNLNVLTTLQRPLSGQSRHVFNSIFEFENPITFTVARLLFNYQGARITDVGALGLPDIIQSGYPRLDAVLIQPFSENQWSLKLSAENLLNHTYKYIQGGEIQRAYKTGMIFSVGLSYNFFTD